MEAVEHGLVGYGGGDVVYGGWRHCRPGGELVEAIGGILREREGVGMLGRSKGVRMGEEAVELLGLDVAQQRSACAVEIMRGLSKEVCGEGVCGAISTGASRGCWHMYSRRAAALPCRPSWLRAQGPCGQRAAGAGPVSPACRGDEASRACKRREVKKKKRGRGGGGEEGEGEVEGEGEGERQESGVGREGCR